MIPHRVRLAFACLAALWVLLLAAAPAVAFGVPASGIVYSFGSLICHQRPERSFHMGMAQVPVCARCLGLYVGAAAGAIGALMLWRSNSRTRPLTRAHLRTLLVVCATPTALTWLLEMAGMWASSNPARFVAALPLGAVIALTVNYGECVPPQQNEFKRPLLPM